MGLEAGGHSSCTRTHTSGSNLALVRDMVTSSRPPHGIDSLRRRALEGERGTRCVGRRRPATRSVAAAKRGERSARRSAAARRPSAATTAAERDRAQAHWAQGQPSLRRPPPRRARARRRRGRRSTSSGRGVRSRRRERAAGGAPSTGTTRVCTSSGVTKSRPSSAAHAWAAAGEASEARGLAPSRRSGVSRVARAEGTHVPRDVVGHVARHARRRGPRAALPATSTTSTSASGSRGAEAGQHLRLLIFAGVAHAQAQQEAVELGLRQREGALELHRVLGGEHEERPRQRVRRARRPVTLRSSMASRKADCVRGVARLISSARTTLAKMRPGAERRTARCLVEDEEPVTSRRQEVGGALQAREAQAQAGGEAYAPAGSWRRRARRRCSTCPPASRATRTRRVWSALPTMTRLTCSSTARPISAALTEVPCPTEALQVTRRTDSTARRPSAIAVAAGGRSGGWWRSVLRRRSTENSPRWSGSCLEVRNALL